MKSSFIGLSMALLFFFASMSAVSARGITFWTTEVERERMMVQNAIAADFSRTTGISVRIVPVEENLLPERITAAFAAKALPDVVYHPLDLTVGWVDAGLLDCRAASDIIAALGRETFAAGPLALVRLPHGYGAVPVDGWGQLLLYRKDLFREKNLSPPDRWETILAAAAALHNPPLMWGFQVATDPGQVYTQQVFEHIALSNKVKLIAEDGSINLDTPEMVETLEFYKALFRFSPPGNLYWLHTRLDYLSGRAAMIIWSPFILDELSGLRRDQPVLPDIARGEPGYLAANTGFVTTIAGLRGAAQYGQTNYIGITSDADRKAAGRWVHYLLTEGYLDWLGMAAEGKLPLRRGTSADPDRFVTEWMELEFGITTRARISQFYGMDLVEALMSGAENYDRWGFMEGQGALVSKIYGTGIITEILKRYLDGELTAKETAAMMNDRVKRLQ